MNHLYFRISPINQFRILSAIEGLSLVALLFIAMPLRHYFDLYMAVRVVGMIHGILWLVYLVGTLAVSHKAKWSVLLWIFSLIVSVIPFGFVAMEMVLRKQQAAA